MYIYTVYLKKLNYSYFVHDNCFIFYHHSPQNYKVPAGMRGHAIEDILKHFSLLVKCLTHFPLQQVHVPQMALSQHPVQHYRWRCFHLHRHSPPSQRIPISHLDGTEVNLCIHPCIKKIFCLFFQNVQLTHDFGIT